MILSIVKGAKRVRATETILSKQGILEIPLNSSGFKLLQQIRDESHRFAISSNRKKKNKSGKADPASGQSQAGSGMGATPMQGMTPMKKGGAMKKSYSIDGCAAKGKTRARRK